MNEWISANLVDELQGQIDSKCRGEHIWIRDKGSAMTKADLVDIIAEGTGLTKVETAAVVDGLFATIRNALKAGHRIEIRGFGRFQVVQRAERIGRNPKSGETVRIPAYKTVRFSCSRLLQDALNQPED